MFATDIILLGSLNENDIDGIPQLFKYLPSTTENTPAIATEVLASENESDTDTGNASDAGNDENILGDEEKRCSRSPCFFIKKESRERLQQGASYRICRVHACQKL